LLISPLVDECYYVRVSIFYVLLAHKRVGSRIKSNVLHSNLFFEIGYWAIVRFEGKKPCELTAISFS